MRGRVLIFILVSYVFCTESVQKLSERTPSGLKKITHQADIWIALAGPRGRTLKFSKVLGTFGFSLLDDCGRSANVLGRTLCYLGGMTGPLVNQSQQINRAHMQLPSYYTRNNVPRTVPNMPTVVNQASQQPTSQYSHAVQMVPPHSIHPMTPIIVNPGLAPQMYSQAPYAVINPSQPMFNNSRGNANDSYEPHQLSTQQTPATTQQARKRIPIIDPNTGKNILEGVNEETSTLKDDTKINSGG